MGLLSLFLSHPAKAILDTGATQTAGSAEAVWALVTSVIELKKIEKQLMQCHVRAGHIGKTSLKDFLRRKGCAEWLEDMVDGLQCDACLEFGSKPGPASVSLLKPPRLWQCCGMHAWELTKGTVKQFLVVFVVKVDIVKAEEFKGKSWEHRSQWIFLLLGQGGCGKTFIVQE